jgi:hypothetical protein
MVTMPITLTDQEFALLYEYLDREHSMDWDPDSVGLTTKIGFKLWRRIQKVATEQGFTPKHTPIDHGLRDMPVYYADADD